MKYFEWLISYEIGHCNSQEYGPNASLDLGILDVGHRYRSPERTEFNFYERSPRSLERRLPERDVRFQERSVKPKARYSTPPKRNSVQKKPMKVSNKPGVIPKFVLPCKDLMVQMQSSIDNMCKPDEKKALLKLIRVNIRKRLIVALENKPYLPTKAINKLYRTLYPSSTDASFIKNQLIKLREAKGVFEDVADNTPGIIVKFYYLITAVISSVT